MSEEQEIMDYEALNAKTALDLNKAKQEIKRLTKLQHVTELAVTVAESAHQEAESEIEQLEAVVEDFKQFAAYLAVKSEYDLFRKTEEYAAFFDNLAALKETCE